MSEKKMQKWDFLKNLKENYKSLYYTIIGVFIAVALFTAGSMPIFGQSTVSRGLDAVGAHKQAMIMDMVGGGNYNLFSKAASLDPSKPESCKKIWSLAGQKLELESQVSDKYYFEISPVNKEYKDLFSVNLQGSESINADKLSAQMNMVLGLQANPTKLAKIFEAEESIPSQLDYENISFNIGGKAGTDVKNVYFTLDQLKLEMGDEKHSGALNDWYGLKTEIKDEEYEGLNDFISTFLELRGTKLKEVISKETGEQMGVSFCKLIEDVEVGKIDTYKFGHENKDELKARQINIVFKEDYQQILGREVVEITEKLSKDDVFKDYLKSKYEWYKDLYKAAEKMGETEEELLSKKDFEKEIDDMFKDFDKKKLLDELKNYEETQDEVYVDTHQLSIFLNPLDGKISAYSFSANIKWDGLENYEGEAKKALSEGLKITYSVYDIKYGEKAVSPEKVKEYKDISTFSEDVENTDFIKSLNDKSQEYLDEQGLDENLFSETFRGIISQITGIEEEYNYDEDYNQEYYYDYDL